MEWVRAMSVTRIYPDRGKPPVDLDRERLIEEVITLRQEVEELAKVVNTALRLMKNRGKEEI